MWQSSLVWTVFLLIIFIALKSQFESLLKCLVNLCNKTSSFEYGNFKLGLDSKIQLGEQGKNDLKYVEMLKAFQSPIVTNEERAIRNQLAEIGYAPKQAIEILIAQLAYKNILTLFLFIDKNIYEEQIKLLIFLNEQYKPFSALDLQHFYNDWKSKAEINTKSKIDYTYEQFLLFLIVNGLIIQNTVGYVITLLGKDYLSFVVRQGRQIFSDTSKNNNDQGQ